MKNYLPQQYKSTEDLEINHNYLKSQFDDYEEIFNKIKKVVIKGDYTLGSEVDILESEFSKLCEVKHSIAVGSGTDAIFLGLKALDIGANDEVITTAFTFYATVGAIVATGAKPVFCDINDDYNMRMGHVDISDQLRNYYHFDHWMRKTKWWWEKSRVLQ